MSKQQYNIQVDEWVTSVEELLEHGGSKDALMALVIEKLGVSHFLALNRLTLADLVVWTLIANDLKVFLFILSFFFVISHQCLMFF